jgi:hypothetical protein
MMLPASPAISQPALLLLYLPSPSLYLPPLTCLYLESDIILSTVACLRVAQPA